MQRAVRNQRGHLVADMLVEPVVSADGVVFGS